MAGTNPLFTGPAVPPAQPGALVPVQGEGVFCGQQIATDLLKCRFDYIAHGLVEVVPRIVVPQQLQLHRISRVCKQDSHMMVGVWANCRGFAR